MSPHSRAGRAQRPHRSWCSQEGGDKPGTGALMLSSCILYCLTISSSHSSLWSQGPRSLGLAAASMALWAPKPSLGLWSLQHILTSTNLRKSSLFIEFILLVNNLLCCNYYLISVYKNNLPALTEKILEPYGQSFNMNHFGTLNLLSILRISPFQLCSPADGAAVVRCQTRQVFFLISSC